MENAIEIKNLCKNYPNFKLNNLNITVPKGLIMGFIGQNGSGKTTTIKSMFNIIKSEYDCIKLLDNSIEDKSNLNHIGVCLDECLFPEYLKLNEINIIMKNAYTNWDENKFFEFANKFNLNKSKKIKEYSKGMKTKLSLACALSHNAKLLILDEPTSGLDPVAREDIVNILLDFVKNKDNSIFISSHITSDLEKLCDIVTFIDNGSIIFSKNREEIFDKYGLINCTKEKAQSVNSDCIIGKKVSEFNCSLLVDKQAFKNSDLTVLIPTIEDIMLFYIRGEK